VGVEGRKGKFVVIIKGGNIRKVGVIPAEKRVAKKKKENLKPQVGSGRRNNNRAFGKKKSRRWGRSRPATQEKSNVFE